MRISQKLKTLNREIKLLGKTYLNFKQRIAGDYTIRQMSMASSYTVFCHAEIETYLEDWASFFVDIALAEWKNKRVTRPLVHLCTFHEGRGDLTGVPKTDVWSELVFQSIRRHKSTVAANNGIKEQNVCRLFAPVGFDVRDIDPILLADLTAFGSIRGDHAHKGRAEQFGAGFDPFDRKAKAERLLTLLEPLDNQLCAYAGVCT
jgi:hypothetical protein